MARLNCSAISRSDETARRRAWKNALSCLSPQTAINERLLGGMFDGRTLALQSRQFVDVVASSDGLDGRRQIQRRGDGRVRLQFLDKPLHDGDGTLHIDGRVGRDGQPLAAHLDLDERWQREATRVKVPETIGATDGASFIAMAAAAISLTTSTA